MVKLRRVARLLAVLLDLKPTDLLRLHSIW